MSGSLEPGERDQPWLRPVLGHAHETWRLQPGGLFKAGMDSQAVYL